ncbi:MAG: IPT/TIG domain-containing protein [Planctomycetota bacterium]
MIELHRCRFRLPLILSAFFWLVGCSGGGGSSFFPSGEAVASALVSIEPAAVRSGEAKTLTIRVEGLDLSAAGTGGARVVWTPGSDESARRLLAADVVDGETLRVRVPAHDEVTLVELMVQTLDASGAVLSSTGEGVSGYSVFDYSPRSGDIRGGTLVEVRGLILGAEGTVSFGGRLGETVDQDPEAATLEVRVPAGASPGPVDVRVSGLVVPTDSGEAFADLTISNGFRYVDLPPGLDAISPDEASIAGGIEVELRGERFTSDLVVELGGVAVDEVEVIDAATARITVPPSEQLGSLDLLVRNGAGASAPLPFIYRFPVSLRRRGVTPSPKTSSSFGSALASLDDIDQDGFGDFAVGSPQEGGQDGAVRIYSGADGRSIHWTVLGAVGSQERFGASLARLGDDIDLDGREDLLVGAPGADGGAGAVYLLSPGRRVVILKISAKPGDIGLGASVSSLGDIDSDTVPDFGAGLTATSSSPNGAVRVFAGGNPTQVQISIDAPDPLVEDFGIDIGRIGDLDGDGFEDVLIGSRGDGISTFGAAFAFTSGTRQELLRLGGSNGGPFATGPVTRLPDRDGDGLEELAYAAEGRVRIVSGANGDLIDEIDVGSPISALRAAGDMDLDGAVDIAVGSATFGAGIPGDPGPGLALVYCGRSGAELFRLEGNSSVSGLGRAIAGGGALHRDGLPDVLFSSPRATIEGVSDLGATYTVTQDNLVPRLKSIPSGEDLVFDLTAPAEAGQQVFVAFAFGNSPGVKVGTRTIPLTNDVLFQVSLLVTQFRGVFDESGYFRLQLDAENLATLPFHGIPIFTAMITLSPQSEVVVISNGADFVLE